MSSSGTSCGPSSRSAAAANLRKALYYARRALGARRGQVLGSDADLVWSPRMGLVDWTLSGGRRGPPEQRRAYRRAVDLYRDGLLPEDRYEAWAWAAR